MKRNFGLSHFSRRELSSSAKLAPGANAGASFFTWKAAAKRLYHGFSQAQASARAVHIECVYMGRVLFVHDMKICTQALSPSHPVEVNS
jgi:hypothetical protein